MAALGAAGLSWLPILALAGAAFATAVLALRLPRAGYTLLGAALLFGLAGYALQGSPGQPAALGQPPPAQAASGTALVEARRELFGAAVLPSRFVITSDAFARRGDHVSAAAFARSALADNPADAEAWTALGNALVEHAGGRLTPAALYAYGEAAKRAPDSPAPGYFLGLAHLRGGDPERTLAIWGELLARAPGNAEWRPLLAARIRQLRAVLANP